MRQRVVRRVPVKKRRRIRWTPPTWGAIACVTGGILWILTLVTVFANALNLLSYLRPSYAVLRLAFPSTLPLGTWTFILALIFMLVGLVALYIESRRFLTVWGMIALALSAMGLAWAAWPNAWLNLYDFVMGRQTINTTVGLYDPQMPIIWWFERAGSGLVLFTIGFILFALVSLENNAFQRGIIIFLTECLIVMLSVSITWSVLSFDASWDLLWLIFFAIVLQLALFGIGWILLGFALLRGTIPVKRTIAVLATESV